MSAFVSTSNTRSGFAVLLKDGIGSLTCSIFHILHLHDFCIYSAPEDIQGPIDWLCPFRWLFPSNSAIRI